MADDGGASVRPSTVTLPEVPPDGATTLFDFFAQRFPRIPAAVWVERFAAGRIWTDDGPVAADDLYRPLLVVHYRREVEREPPVRTDFRVVWSDRHLLVVDKPPNLPVTPGGRWVKSCLLHLLAEATGNADIVPLHRLDRLTSGLLLLSVDPASRSHYGRLFQPDPLIQKTYTAVSEVIGEPSSGRFTLVHHIARSREHHWRQVVRPGLPANARCEVEVLQAAGGLALLRLRPTTGRKHQIRVQLAEAGLPILGDPLYGMSPSHGPDDSSQRLWLDAHLLAVHGFAGPDGCDLDAEWTSSRPPAKLWRRAATGCDTLPTRR